MAVPGNAAGFIEDRFTRIQAGATSGEAVTYTSWTSFGDAEGAPATSQYLSKRTASGWATENISPFGFTWSPLIPPYNGFSPDLRFGAFKTTDPVLSADCRKGLESMYLRDNETGELHCLSPESPGSPRLALPGLRRRQRGRQPRLPGRHARRRRRTSPTASMNGRRRAGCS